MNKSKTFRSLVVMMALTVLWSCEPDPKPEPPVIGTDIYVDIDCAERIPKTGYSHQTYFQGSYYLLSDQFKNFDQARQAAASLGGYLVTIQSQAENQVVQTLLDNASRPCALIGLSDHLVEETHRWLNGEVVFYTNWQNLEPNNQAYGYCANSYNPQCEEDAVTIASKRHLQPGGWNDVPRSLTYPFVIEIDCEMAQM